MNGFFQNLERKASVSEENGERKRAEFCEFYQMDREN